MYDLSGTLGRAAVPPGTAVLGFGPPMVGKQELGYRLLAEGLDAGEGAVVVTTNTAAGTVRERIEDLLVDRTALERLALVDATGNREDGEAGDRVRVVGSPADLTGIGIGVTAALEGFDADGIERARVLVDTISALTVYTDFERVYRFVHVLTGRIDDAGALGWFTLQSDAADRERNAFRGVFDATVEFRERDGRTERRIHGLGDGPAEWEPVDVGGRPVVSARDRAGSITGREPLEAGDSIGSLHAAIEELESERQTLTLYNVDATADGIDALADYFGRLNVEVRTAELPTETPRDTALLHRGEEPVAVAPIEALHSALGFDAEGGFDERPSVLQEADRDGYGIENGGKRYMIRVSRMIEGQALDIGAGTLHTGFQELDRVTDDYGTEEMYERLAASTVDVHLYGLPGTVPNRSAYTIHDDRTEELERSWFVVFDGDGDPARKVALVTEEREPDRFYGFWTRRPEFVDRITAYLERTYGTSTATAGIVSDADD